MATAQLGAVKRVIETVRTRAGDDGADGELLERFRATRDDAAFTGLVRRHGGMVLGVCRRVLRDPHAAEDAFQAVFLVLARKAGVIRPPGLLGPWLYGVAYRTALKARGREYRRRQVEQDFARTNRRDDPVAPSADADLRPVLDQQVHELPEKYRLPLVLCAVQGLGKAEAAERLGLPEGTVSSRLARAREMLRDRLTRRGIAVPAVVLGGVLVPGSLRAAVPTELSAAAANVALGAAPAAPAVLTLTHEVLSAMTLTKLKLLAAVAVAVALTGGGFGLYTASADEKKPGEKPAAVKPGDKPAKPEGEKPAKPTGDTPEKPKPAKPDNPNKPKPEKPADPNKPKPQKPAGAVGPKVGGVVASVDAAARTVTLTTKTEKGVTDKVVHLAADAKVVVDGKAGELSAVPKGAFASFIASAAKDAGPIEATEVRVTGPSVGGVITKVNESSVTIEYPSKEGKTTRELTLAPGGKVLISKTMDSKLTDLKVGDKVSAVLSTDQTGALTVSIVRDGDPGDKPKPTTKPDKSDDEN